MQELIKIRRRKETPIILLQISRFISGENDQISVEVGCHKRTITRMLSGEHNIIILSKWRKLYRALERRGASQSMLCDLVHYYIGVNPDKVADEFAAIALEL
jgi:hypothetical protein